MSDTVTPTPEPLLEVRGLTTAFPTARGLILAAERKTPLECGEVLFVSGAGPPRTSGKLSHLAPGCRDLLGVKSSAQV